MLLCLRYMFLSAHCCLGAVVSLELPCFSIDMSVQCVDSVKEDLVGSNDWGLLWGAKSNQGTSPVGSLTAEIGSALVLLSNSAPPLEDHKACFAEKDKDGEEMFAQREESSVVKLASDSEFRENEELRNSKSIVSFEADVNEKKKTVAVDKKPPTSLKLVSAMKGSREKRGIRVEKLSVSWAADVYDPPVTSQSHTVTNDNQHGFKTSKKSYRNKNKHKASRKSNNEKKKSFKTDRNTSKVACY